jgi:hypothetical protein
MLTGRHVEVEVPMETTVRGGTRAWCAPHILTTRPPARAWARVPATRICRSPSEHAGGMFPRR